MNSNYTCLNCVFHSVFKYYYYNLTHLLIQYVYFLKQVVLDKEQYILFYLLMSYTAVTHVSDMKRHFLCYLFPQKGKTRGEMYV